MLADLSDPRQRPSGETHGIEVFGPKWHWLCRSSLRSALSKPTVSGSIDTTEEGTCSGEEPSDEDVLHVMSVRYLHDV